MRIRDRPDCAKRLLQLPLLVIKVQRHERCHEVMLDAGETGEERVVVHSPGPMGVERRKDPGRRVDDDMSRFVG